ncbi:MAG: helix-turn-helix domain-containing protein [Pseudomonadota bacterium]
MPFGAEKQAEASECPIRSVLANVTGKWRMIIILTLGQGPLRFGELKRGIGDITQRVLTENLRGLQRDGYLTRTVDPGPPVAVSYELTPLGRGLLSTLKPLVIWSNAQMGDVKAARLAYDRDQAEE